MSDDTTAIRDAVEASQEALKRSAHSTNTSWIKRGSWDVALIIVTALSTLAITLFVNNYSHREDTRADFAKRQLDAWVNSLVVFDKVIERPEMDMRTLVERVKLGLFLDQNTIEELAKLEDDDDGKCYNNLSQRCLRIIIRGENIIRKGLNLPIIPPDIFADFVGGGGVAERIDSFIRSGGFRDISGDYRRSNDPDPAPASSAAVVPAPAPAPTAVPAPVPTRSYLVFFDWGKSNLTDRARQIIAEAAANSTKVQYTRIEVNGYTDTSGTPKSNQALSVSHAQAVAAELVEDGVPSNAISIQGFGDTHLLVPTGLGVREPQNRRTEIIIR
jgi:outer membrane protein OmpA-like peptidoglycan-associated protein